MNTATGIYVVLRMRDYSHGIATIGETFDRVRFKGYHVIAREFPRKRRSKLSSAKQRRTSALVALARIAILARVVNSIR